MRLIELVGVSVDASGYSDLVDVSAPPTAGELCKYAHALAWVRTSIKHFLERSAPLHELLEKTYQKSGKYTSRAWLNNHKHLLNGIQTIYRRFRDSNNSLSRLQKCLKEFYRKEDPSRQTPVIYLGP